MKTFYLLMTLIPMLAFAEGKVKEIKSSKKLIITITQQHQFNIQDRVIIVSKQDNTAIAFGHITKFHSSGDATIFIDEVINSSLIMNDDVVYPLDYKLLKKKKIPGFTSLTLSGAKSKKAPAMYKDLAYFGALTAEGHALDKYEFLASPFQIQYGVTNKFGLRFINALWFDNYINLGFKYQIMKNEYAKLTLNSFAAHNTSEEKWLIQAGGILTLPSNAKFENHISVNFRLDPAAAKEESNNPISRGIPIFQDSDIRNITEYITSDWNRILFGPVYNVELNSFGGTVSYMWIWDHFHMSLGVATRDFSELKVGTKGYYLVYDMFWRF